MNDLASSPFVNLSDVETGDTVLVTVYRAYGFEQEGDDTWSAPVVATNPAKGIGVDGGAYGHGEPIRWLDVRGLNPDGLDPGYTNTRLRVRRSDTDAYRPVVIR